MGVQRRVMLRHPGMGRLTSRMVRMPEDIMRRNMSQRGKKGRRERKREVRVVRARVVRRRSMTMMSRRGLSFEDDGI